MRLLSFIQRTDLPESHFAVKVVGGKNLRTNLPEIDGVYQGVSNGLSLMGLDCWKLGRSALTGW